MLFVSIGTLLIVPNKFFVAQVYKLLVVAIHKIKLVEYLQLFVVE